MQPGQAILGLESVCGSGDSLDQATPGPSPHRPYWTPSLEPGSSSVGCGERSTQDSEGFTGEGLRLHRFGQDKEKGKDRHRDKDDRREKPASFRRLPEPQGVGDSRGVWELYERLTRWPSQRFRDIRVEQAYQQYVTGSRAQAAERVVYAGLLISLLYGPYDLLVRAYVQGDGLAGALESCARPAYLVRYGFVVPLLLVFLYLLRRIMHNREMKPENGTYLGQGKWWELSAAVGISVVHVAFVAVRVLDGVTSLNPLFLSVPLVTEPGATALAAFAHVVVMISFQLVSPAAVLARQALDLIWSYALLGLARHHRHAAARSRFLHAWLISLHRDSLRREKSRSSRILRNIVPPTVADRLHLGERAIADYTPVASLLVASIDRFPHLCTRIPPDRLVHLLNRLFSAFDTTCDLLGLEKLRSASSCYTVVAGVPSPSMVGKFHSVVVADMALLMMRQVEMFNEFIQEPDLKFRLNIGIATGPVVSGLVGKRKMTYDLFGETVGKAYQLAITPRPLGCAAIQISPATYESIEDESRYLFEFVDVISTGKKKKTRLIFIKEGYVPFSEMIEQQMAFSPDQFSDMESSLSNIDASNTIPISLHNQQPQNQQNSINSESSKEFQTQARKNWTKGNEEQPLLQPTSDVNIYSSNTLVPDPFQTRGNFEDQLTVRPERNRQKVHDSRMVDESRPSSHDNTHGDIESHGVNGRLSTASTPKYHQDRFISENEEDEYESSSEDEGKAHRRWDKGHEEILENEQPSFHKWSLRFQDPENEAMFMEYYGDYVRSYLMVAGVLGFFFISTSSVLDALVAPSQKFANLFITRFAIITPSYLISLYVATKYRSIMEHAIFWSVLSLGVGQILTVYYIDDSSTIDYAFYGLVFVVLYGFCCVRLRFLYGSLIALVLLAAFNFLCLYNGNFGRVSLVRYNVSLFVVILIGAFISYDLERQVRQEWMLIKISQDVRRSFQSQKETSDALILNVLPDFVVKRLQANFRQQQQQNLNLHLNQPHSRKSATYLQTNAGLMISRRFSNVSILVVGIVDFSRLCSRYTHVQLVTLLAELFGALDDAVFSVPGVEKIKTYGDMYVAAAGLSDYTVGLNHHYSIAHTAMAMQRILDRFNAINYEKWNFRIGIHSGPCLAGVIGTKKYVYDLFGEAVNVADHLQRTARPGRIHCTQDTVSQLESLFTFEESGIQLDLGRGDPSKTHYLLATRHGRFNH